MSNIFISGSKGLIGSQLTQHLRSKAHSIIETDMKDGIDLSDSVMTNDLFKELSKKSNKIDAAVLCHGLNHHVRVDKGDASNIDGLELLDIRDLEEYFNANVVSVANTIYSLVKYFPSVKSIIVFGSIYSSKLPLNHLYDKPKSISYVTSKHALYGLIKYLASYIGKNNGVRINLLSPGCIEADQPERFKKDFKKYTTLGRLSTPKDLFGIIELLISDSGKYITGQDIKVDGGFLL